MNAAVFLDRDGVLNQTVVRHGVPHPPAHVSACVLLPGVREACENLRSAGYLLFVVTNQPDVARGHQTREHVEGINAWIQSTLPVQQVLTCYHDNVDQCACRKPKPGMLCAAAQAWDVALAESIIVGDRWSDVEAGRAAGCRSILIERAYSGRERCQPDWVVRDLLAAAHVILHRGDIA
ncbi:MAG TPA: HAD family hydrolase [Candidatus Tectomicrobia bacterium]